MCDCFSYNWQEGETPNVTLNPNYYFDWDNEAKNVSVDACIANQIRLLWANGIWTGGCCCGHNGEFFNDQPYDGDPYVILDEGEDPASAVALLKQHDPNRNWRVLQWQLVEA